MRPPLLPVAFALLSTACSTTVNTLPPVVSPTAAVSELSLEVPAGLEVRSALFSATMYSDVSGTNVPGGVTGTNAGGRAFVQVLAVDRVTQEQVLLIYENVATRTKPIQIIRFRSAPTTTGTK